MHYRLLVEERAVPDIKIFKWASLGWIMHLVCEKCINDLSVGVMDEFLKNIKNQKEICRNEWSQSWPDVPLYDDEIPPLEEKQILRGYVMVRNIEIFRRKLLALNPLSIECERGFSIFLDKEKQLEFHGRIDAVIKFKDGSCWILDYKSSQPRTEHKVVPPQLERYGIAISKMDNIPISKIKGVIFNLESGNVIEREFSAATANKLLNEMVDTICQIKDCDPEAARPITGIYCFPLCPYQKKCYQKRQRGM